ncbi:hypothetical protein YC2023_112980 [Brassica napus]
MASGECRASFRHTTFKTKVSIAFFRFRCVWMLSFRLIDELGFEAGIRRVRISGNQQASLATSSSSFNKHLFAHGLTRSAGRNLGRIRAYARDEEDEKRPTATWHYQLFSVLKRLIDWSFRLSVCNIRVNCLTVILPSRGTISKVGGEKITTTPISL